MGETLNLLFRRCEDGAYKLQAKESRSGRVISGSFVPPYQTRQLNTLLKKLNTFESDDRELREIGQHLYQSLIGAATHVTDRRESSEQTIKAVFRSIIQGALGRGLSSLIEDNRLILDRLEPPTFDGLVRYLNSLGGAGAFDDKEIAYPCYAIHFDGHGAFRRQCPADTCDELNDINARSCSECGASLRGVDPQTYLCFCDNEGRNRLIDTETLRELLVSSDVRLAVFAACETATLTKERSSHRQRQAAIDATLATALVVSQVPAVIAMPFSIEDELSPTFMFHFYEALANGRTLEEALSRARQAMLPMSKHHSWFIP